MTPAELRVHHGEKRACEGAETRPHRMGCEHFEVCRACQVAVRDDMVDHPFFGFKSACAAKDFGEQR